MELLLDVHTHHAPAVSGQAIEYVRFPEPFRPEPGRYYSLGIHPWDTDQFDITQVDWELFRKWAAHPQVLAIGETGIDKLVHKNLQCRQQLIFSRQLCIANDIKKPIIIHNVRATGILGLCRQYSGYCLPWIQHGFRGNAGAARQATLQGLYLSLGPRYNEEALKVIPLEQLLLETDDSGIDIHEVYRRAAETLGMPVEELTATVQENIQRVFFNHEEL